jgi:hypothetical protein
MAASRTRGRVVDSFSQSDFTVLGAPRHYQLLRDQRGSDVQWRQAEQVRVICERLAARAVGVAMLATASPAAASAVVFGPDSPLSGTAEARQSFSTRFRGPRDALRSYVVAAAGWFYARRDRRRHALFELSGG